MIKIQMKKEDFHLMGDKIMFSYISIAKILGRKRLSERIKYRFEYRLSSALNAILDLMIDENFNIIEWKHIVFDRFGEIPYYRIDFNIETLKRKLNPFKRDLKINKTFFNKNHSNSHVIRSL